MRKNALVLFLCLAVAALLSVAYFLTKPTPPPPSPPDGSVVAERVPDVKPVNGTFKRKGQSGLTGSNVDRIPQRRTIANTFVMIGKGHYAKWGRGLNATFTVTGSFVADAEIKSREKFGNGRFKVVEDRTFLTAREMLTIDEADYFLALDTLPIDEVSQALEVVGKISIGVGKTLIATVAAAKAGAITVASGVGAELVAKGLRLFKVNNNGRPLKAFSDKAVEKVNETVESMSQDWLSRTPKEIESMVRSVEGRTYRFTYINDATDKPVNITAERLVDGRTRPIETDEEVWILSRCNTFIDACFLDDGGSKAPQPGDNWSTDASFLAGLVGIDGYCDGRLSGYRDADEATSDGPMWKIKINPAELDVKDDEGRNLGKISVGGGEATVRNADKTVHDFAFKGTGKLTRVNRNSILFLPFNENFIGDCHFAGKMTTENHK